MEILEAAHLGYLVEREGGWDSQNDWNDVLSGIYANFKLKEVKNKE